LRLVIARLPGLLPAALCALALAGCDRQNAPAPQGKAPEAAAAASVNAQAPAEPAPSGRLDRSHAGDAAPDQVFEDGEGRPIRLSAFRGRPMLVNFWATWCGPCIVEMPSLDALAARETGNLAILTVSEDLNGRRQVTDFFAEHRFQHIEPYLDGENRLMAALRVDTLPTTILFDAEGREVWRMTGAADWLGVPAAALLREAGGG
jgi:thiol-disulfide isomerase/thioredoxin